MTGQGDLTEHLRRQLGWYTEWWRWLLQGKVLPGLPPRPSALDVGCGPGFVMDSLSDILDVQGVDRDQDMVSAGRAKGARVVKGDARNLPFEDGSFDIVYCTFLMVWAEDQVAVLREMRRVSRRWVLCLAEPDYEARVDFPLELKGLTRSIVEGVRWAGGDPCAGRRLRHLFASCGLEAEVGVHPGIWSLPRSRHESPQEWEWARSLAGDAAEEGELRRLRAIWEKALEEGSLLQFNPTFYALARK